MEAMEQKLENANKAYNYPNSIAARTTAAKHFSYNSCSRVQLFSPPPLMGGATVRLGVATATPDYI